MAEIVALFKRAESAKAAGLFPRKRTKQKTKQKTKVEKPGTMQQKIRKEITVTDKLYEKDVSGRHLND